MKVTRKIIEINEDLCTGCGMCILDCKENAIKIVDGKAQVIKESLCDGLGACLGSCPTGALEIVERLAEPFDEEEVHANIHAASHAHTAPAFHSGCPGSRMQQFRAPQAHTGGLSVEAEGPGHWPLKIMLVPPSAPFLRGADIVVAADCAAAVTPCFHADNANGKPLLIGCPKFEDPGAFAEKLADIFRSADLNSCTSVRMEVPCCRGIAAAVERAKAISGAKVRIHEHVIGVDGKRIK